MDERWTIGAHDQSIAGWLVTGAYLCATAACVLRGRDRSAPSHDSRIWLLLAAAMAFLAVNKQLDLQSALRFAGRDLTREYGFYHHRALVRLLFVAGLGTACLAVVLVLRKSLLPFLRQNPAVLAGLGLTACYVILSAADARHLRAMESWGVPGTGWHWVLELSGILLIVLGSFLSRGTRPPVASP